MKKVFVWLLVFGLFGLGFWFWKNRGTGKVEISFETAEQIQRRKDIEMAKSLQSLVVGQQGKYSLKVYRLNSDESYGFGETEIMPARSAIKIPIILTAFRLGVEEKYDDLLTRMGLYSDNSAQIKMEKNLGVNEILKMISLLELSDTSFEDNTTTASDLVLAWKYIYKDYERYEKYFTDSIYEDRIAKGIPEGVKLIHKVGTDIDVWNDSGIIMPQIPNPKSQTRLPDGQVPNNNQITNSNNSNPFIVVILNEGVNREEADEMVPKLTKMVWDYETSL